MPIERFQITFLISLRKIRTLRAFFKRLSFEPYYFLIPAFLALASSVFEGVSIGLLIPLIKGMIALDYGFARSLPVLGSFIALLPGLFRTKTAVFVFLILIILLTASLKLIFQYASVLISSRLIRKFTDHLRREIFSRYLQFGKLFFDRTSAGYLHEILMTLTQRVGSGLTDLKGMLNQLFLLFVYLVMLFSLSWKLTLATLVLFPVLRTSVEWVIRKMRRTSRDYVLAQKELSKEMFNVISCIPLVKAYSMEPEEMKRFTQTSRSVRLLEFSMDKKSNFIQPLQEIIMLAALLILVSVTALLLVKDRNSGAAAGFLVYFFVLRRAAVAFGILNHIKGSLANITGPLAEIRKILQDDQDKFLIPEGQEEFTGLKEGIEFKNLNFSYGEGRGILKNISFKIEKGKITAIVGPTGSGKSTLVHLLMRFYDVRPGSLLIDGRDVRTFRIPSLRSRMAMVSQETFFFHDSLRANLVYGIPETISDEKITEALRRSRLEAFVRSLPEGLETLIGDRGIQLSGGEKQRLSIARAFLKDAEILILDEATSSLDSETERMIQEAAEELIRGRTTITIAHRLSTVQGADKVVILENGQVAEQGSLSGLLSQKGKFYRYWEDQKVG